MHHQADAVAQAMTEGMRFAGKHVAGTPVDRVRGHTRLHQGHRFRLSLSHGGDHPPLFGGGLAHHDRSGGIAVVAAGDRAEVDDHHIAERQHPIRGATVRQGAMLTSRHDRVEGRAVCPQLAESLLEQKRDIALPKAAENTLDYGTRELDLGEIPRMIKDMKEQMYTAAEDLNFEEAAKLRDKIKSLEQMELALR